MNNNFELKDFDFNDDFEPKRVSFSDIAIKIVELSKKNIEKPIVKTLEIEKKKQDHILFKDVKNYKEFYDQINNYYDDESKTLVNGNSHFVSRKNIIEPLEFLLNNGIGRQQILNDMQHYKYVDIDKYMQDKKFLCFSGKTDAEKTTRLISIFLSIMTEKKQNNKYYDIPHNVAFLVWDDVLKRLDFWKNNEYLLCYNFEYIFIDDIFNRELNEFQKDNVITILRNAESNGTKIIFTTNCDKETFFNTFKDWSESLYSRYNENRFKFVECEQKNNRRK